MHVEDIMTRNVKCCGADDTLDSAARLMWDNDCGCAPVMDEQGRVEAMITDRDVCMAAWSQGRRLGELHVRDAMSGSLHSVGPRDSLAKAERLMQEQQVRRLPVIDEDGHLRGLISLNDLARESARERMQRQRAITFDDVAITLAAVCRPRGCVVPPETEQAHRPAALLRPSAAATA